MSSLYVTEPPTHGKVLVTTNRGEIEIELWSKEAPKAVRNFVQLCLEGYYIDTVFHRIVPDFIIQGGDPTATGTGGQSIYDEPFQDEFHSRLKFNRRGLLGMANNGKNDNGSQFFLTLNAALELQGKNTLFGRVVGDTIYNLIKMGQSELEDGTDRPLYPPRVTKTEVLVNPFSDIVPRTTREEFAKRQSDQKKANVQVPKSVKQNKKLLSFAADDDGDEEEQPMSFKVKRKSTYDVEGQANDGSSESFPKRASIPRKRKITPPVETDSRATVHAIPKNSSQAQPLTHVSPSPPPSPLAQPPIDPVQAQIDALKSTLKRKKQTTDPVVKPQEKLSYLAQQKLVYQSRALIGGRKNRRVTGFAEEDVLSDLSKFHTKISSATTSSSPVAGAAAAVAADSRPVTNPRVAGCVLHGISSCMSCSTVLQNPDDEDDTDWFKAPLICEEDRPGRDARFRDRADMELEIIDPREKAGQLALAARQARRKEDEKSGRNAYLRAKP